MNTHSNASTEAKYCPPFKFIAPLCLLALAAGCAKQQAAAPVRPPTPVVIGKVTQKTMPIQVLAVGNVESISTVAIKAQVSGVLQDLRFKEGDFVKKGQVLLTIDPRPFETALAQAQAALARDKAVAANSRVQSQRYEKLKAEGVVSTADADNIRTTADAAEAVVASDEANVQAAKLNLEYCTIYSPIDGRTGAAMVKPGNLIKVADVPIVVINSVNPVYVNFTVPQQYWSDIKREMAVGKLRVTATIPQDLGTSITGSLTFVDNAVDAQTGTIHIRATFDNAQNRLWPGLYVNIVLTLSEQPNATVVPAQAIATGQNGAYVYVVKANNTVEQRAVTSDRTVGSDAVITKGVEPGETVVVDGQVNLTPNARIEAKSVYGETKPPAASGTAKPAEKGAKEKSADSPSPSKQGKKS